MKIVGNRIVGANRAAELGTAAGSESGWYYGSISGGIASGITAGATIMVAPVAAPALAVVSAAAGVGYVAGGLIGSRVGKWSGEKTGSSAAAYGYPEEEIVEQAAKAGGDDATKIGVLVGIAVGSTMSQPQVVDKMSTIVDNVLNAMDKIDIPSNATVSNFMPQLTGEDVIIKAI